jgi:uncharacterized protein YjiS (DUF1127 family)
LEDFAMRSTVRPFDWDALTPLQKSAWTRDLVRQAHAARTRAVGRMLLGWARYIRYRRRRRELAELALMDDRMLRDVGVNRFDIDAAIRSGRSLDRTHR